MDNELKVQPIVDRVMKDFHGRVVNFVEQPTFTFGKEMQLHVMEIRPNAPFASPEEFDETMHGAVLTINDFLRRKYGLSLLGTGMHPLLKLEETGIWRHRHRQIYEAYGKIFSLHRHGWLNIQSFQLNLPYSDEKSGILLHNLLANVCAYLPAVSASSPVYEGVLGADVDNRLRFYAENQKEVPSVTGDVIPQYVSSFSEYQDEVIENYSSDLNAAGADELILHRDWVNSRGVIFRFDRKALEVRVMDEQECVRSDVALSCFIRAVLRGLIRVEKAELLSHENLVKDFDCIARHGLETEVRHRHGKTARQVCQHFFKTAWENATEEEKKYLRVICKRIEEGSLSEIMRERIQRRAAKTDLTEAIISIYSRLRKSLIDNVPYL